MACWRGVGRTTVHPEQDGVSPYWSLYDTDFAGGGWAVAPNDSSSALPAFIVNKETGRVLVVKGAFPPPVDQPCAGGRLGRRRAPHARAPLGVTTRVGTRRGAGGRRL